MKNYAFLLVLFGFVISSVSMSTAFADEVKTVSVAPIITYCGINDTEKCMMLREHTSPVWDSSAKSIEGLNYVEGNSYVISAKITRDENPSVPYLDKKYELIEILEVYKQHKPYTWESLCVPGYYNINGTCIFNFRCGGENADIGVPCSMDGFPQKYLSPLQQHSAGMSHEDIVCAKPMQLILKKDSSPLCVKSETIDKLVQRGWSDNFEHMTSSYMDITVPTLEDFKNTLSEPYNIDTIFSKFGEPHDDIGSGIHIYVYEINDLTEIWVGYADGILYVKHVDSDGNELENMLVKKTESKTTSEDDFDLPEVKLFLEKYPQAGIISDHMQYDMHKKHYTYTDSHTGDYVNLVLTKHIETENTNSILSCHLDQNQNKAYGMIGSEKIIEYLQNHDCLSESNIGNLEPLTIRESFLELGFGCEEVMVFITDMANSSAVSMNLFVASQEWDTIPISSLVGAHDRLPETSSDDRRGPGTMVSETVKAGTYIKQNDEKEFWYTIGGSEDQIITIELQDHEYDRITFVSDKNHEWIEQINDIVHFVE